MNLLLIDTPDDIPYRPRLKPLTAGAKVFLYSQPIITWFQLASYCKQRDITGIITTSTDCLRLCLGKQSSSTAAGIAKASINNYAGSMFRFEDIEVLIINPLPQLFTVSYGAFLAKRYLSKLLNRGDWLKLPEFNWTLLTTRNIEEEYERVKDWELSAVDIETFKLNLAIRCVGFTFATLDDTGSFVTRSLVLPLDSEFNVEWCKRFCATKAAKIFQNGKYDQAYLLRYGIICNNWLWDTLAMMHCWYAELPRDLAFISGFLVRESMYWKDLAQTQDLYQYYLYNAKDTHQTVCSFLAWISEAPQWARQNYLMEFPVLFPNLLAEMTGIARDPVRHIEARRKVDEKITGDLTELRTMVGNQNFNPNSPKQVLQLVHCLGNKDLDSTNEIYLKKAALRHPISSRILNRILDIRGNRKLATTYLRVDADANKENDWYGAVEFHGRTLYSISPTAETGRNRSGEHAYWCGVNIQNQPSDLKDPELVVKSTFKADPGYLLFEIDYEQAETWCTAYITGDPNLIANINSPRYFHAINAEAFFGIAYEQLYNDIRKAKLNKPVINISKRTNHGANYNMGPGVLIDTMGEDKIWDARRLLNLPSGWTAFKVAEYLLDRFAKTYPIVRNDYQQWIKLVVLRDSLLRGSTGWTRYCFGSPNTNKRDLNSYIAHCPQSLNGMTLNAAWVDVFENVFLPNVGNLKLCAQIHDSIFGQYRVGHEHLVHEIKRRMERKIKIKDIKGVEREFTVPAAIKLGKEYWNELE